MITIYATPVQEISANAMMTTQVIRFPLCRASSPLARVHNINIYIYTLYDILHRRTIGVTQRNVPITRLYWSLCRNFDRHTDALERRILLPLPPRVVRSNSRMEWLLVGHRYPIITNRYVLKHMPFVLGYRCSLRADADNNNNTIFLL
jgi:hypothetical protein